jgi:UDP-glucose 4-epimerase
MKVLLTGGAGFIASNLAEAYLEAGHDVTIIDNLSHGKRENVPEGAEFIEMDITDPRLGSVFSSGRFDLVNHHAAQIDVRVSVHDPILDARINLLGLLNLTENCRKYDVERFIFASSGGVIYGETDLLPAVETLPKLPMSPYGVSKYAGESYLFYYRMLYGIKCVTVRYSNVYGPKQDPEGEAGVIAIFSRNHLRGESPTIFGDGEQQRDYVFVRDIARANLMVSEADLHWDAKAPDDLAFNVGTGVPTSVNELARHFNCITGKNRRANYAPPRAGELFRNYLDCGKIRRYLGWEPQVSLREGLEITYNWFSERWEG